MTAQGLGVMSPMAGKQNPDFCSDTYWAKHRGKNETSGLFGHLQSPNTQKYSPPKKGQGSSTRAKVEVVIKMVQSVSLCFPKIIEDIAAVGHTDKDNGAEKLEKYGLQAAVVQVVEPTNIASTPWKKGVCACVHV